jgi:hypothetical protein
MPQKVLNIYLTGTRFDRPGSKRVPEPVRIRMNSRLGTKLPHQVAKVISIQPA